jgi:dGTPase
VITELFTHWMGEPSSLPRSYREKLRHESPARVICDYIAGMTDHYILEQYEKHCGRSAAARMRAD